LINKIKNNLIGIVTLFFSVAFIWWSVSTYSHHKELEKQLDFYVESVNTLNDLEENIINHSKVFDRGKRISGELAFEEIIQQLKKTIKKIQENTTTSNKLLFIASNHYAFVMFMERDYKNFQNASSNAIPAYKKRYTNTLLTVIKSNNKLVAELQTAITQISIYLKTTWQWLFILIIITCLITIGLSIITFLYNTQLEQRKKTEQELLEKDHRLEMIYLQIPTIVYTCDRNLVFTAAKGDELPVFGIEATRLISKVSMYKLFKGYETEETVINAHQRALQGELVRYEHKFKDRYYDMSIHPLQDKGVIIGVIGIAINITERKNTELLLEMKNKELDSFVYKSSHDMRGSLSNIISAAELIKLNPEQAEEMASIIQDKAHYLALLLNDMLELTKVSKNTLQYSLLDVEKFVNETVTAINEKWKENTNFTFTNLTQSSLYTDIKLLKSVFINLLGNAFKYKNPESKQHQITLTVSEDKASHSIIFKIQDTGIGISKEDLEKVFNMFYRASADTDGSGLGLFIVQSAINRLHGSIKLESELKQGTVITVTIPNAEPLKKVA